MNPMRGLIDWIKTGPGPKPPPWDSGAGAKEVARAGMLAGGGGGGGGDGVVGDVFVSPVGDVFVSPVNEDIIGMVWYYYRILRIEE